MKSGAQQRRSQPPIMRRSDGGIRRLGVEVEFGGLSLEAAAEAVSAEVGGRVRQLGRYEREVTEGETGPWRVELDFELLKSLGRRERSAGDVGESLEGLAEHALRALSETVVPVEVISPPLPMDRLGPVNRVIAGLRRRGAKGTGEELAYAFGMQLNPEMPSTGADTIRAYLQSYLCLEDWLRQRARIDATRRLTFFAAPFPKAYVRLVINPEYAPTRDRLIDDYLDANATRNRGLDLMPLFLELDTPRVRARVDDLRIKPRPALHYRLPNSEIDRPDWDLRAPWEDWLVVERLAVQPDRLSDLCLAYSDFLGQPLERIAGDWVAETEKWLRASGLR